MTVKNVELIKKSFLSSFNEHIDQLTNHYEDQLRALKADNQRLIDELAKYKIELVEKETEIQELLTQQAALALVEEEPVALTEFISIEETSSNKIELLEKVVVEKDFARFAECLRDLRLNEYGPGDIERITSSIRHLFEYEYEDFPEIDDSYAAAIALLQSLADNNEVKTFLFNHHELISTKVLELNDPDMITELARTYFAFNFFETLQKFLISMIEQWPFLDSDVNRKSFVRLLWISFYQSLDNRLLNIAEESSSFLNDHLPEIKIYNTYRDMMVNKIGVTNAGTEISKLKKKVTLFTEDEQEKLFKSLDKRIRKKAKRQTSKVSPAIQAMNNTQSKPIMQVSGVRKMDHLTKLPYETRKLPGTEIQLEEELINLAVYKDIFTKEKPTYILVKVLSHNQTGKAYVTPSLLKEVGKKVGRKQAVDVRVYVEKSVHQSNFAWPSTEVKGNAPDDLQDKVVLNEESALKKLGYQITGLTREKRWTILQKAVQQIGLRKVATIIAQNVKLRKGQKNGETKFKYAISEWEHDLGKLKRTFYKNDFTWPSTQLTK